MDKITNVVEKVTVAVNKIYMRICMVLLVFIVLAMFLQVFTRYILNASMTGTEEFGRYCFVWMNLLGAGVCVRKASNASVSILNDMLKGQLKKWHSNFLEITIMILALVLIIQGASLVQVAMGQKSPALGIPVSLVYASVVAGSIGIFLNAGNNILQRMGGEK